MTTDVTLIDPKTLKRFLHDGDEIALFDAREEVPFDREHLLMASCVSLGRLELLVPGLVPNLSTRVVWCDDGEGLAAAAAERLSAHGYTRVSVLDGGVSAWRAAGFAVYNGVHVPSKAFAEVIEHEVGTPWITAEQLDELARSKSDFVLVDTRTFEEFNVNGIPGAISAPGAEIVLRFADMVPSPETTVVVHCGGRTRSIIGAQALIDAGYPNKVVSLRNGTQGWHLAGFEIIEGATATAPEVSPDGLKAAKIAAAHLAQKFRIETMSPARLAGLRTESTAEKTTTYLVDVRTRAEFENGHLAGSKQVAGGQLVQETERHLAVWGATVVLIDDNGVRATITAAWLKQMGWDAHVFALESFDGALETGPFQPPWLEPRHQNHDTVAPGTLHAQMEAGDVRVIDLAWSSEFYTAHLPGAYWALRSRLASALAQVPASTTVVLTSPDGILASLAANDINEAQPGQVSVLKGGTNAWVAAGYPVEQGKERLANPPDDIRLRAREQDTDREAAMREYLAWELDLAEQLASDDDHRYAINEYRS